MPAVCCLRAALRLPAILSLGTASGRACMGDEVWPALSMVSLVANVEGQTADL